MNPSLYFADVSSNNDPIDIEEYASAGHVMLMIKATEGVDYANPFHRGWSLRCGLHHVAVAHYHFARPDEANRPIAEAHHFLAATEGLRGPRDYLVCDIERGTPDGFSHDPAWHRAFDHTIRAYSRFKSILYASRSTISISPHWWWDEPKRVHVADWSTGPDAWPFGSTLWARQFTDGTTGPGPHSLPGIGQCDVSRMSMNTFHQVY